MKMTVWYDANRACIPFGFKKFFTFQERRIKKFFKGESEMMGNVPLPLANYIHCKRLRIII